MVIYKYFTLEKLNTLGKTHGSFNNVRKVWV